MVLPSKELLSTVLGINIESHILLSKDNRSIIYAEISPIGGSIISDINIYELMHMIKEYIKSQNLMIIVYHHLDTVAVEIVQNQKSIYTSPGMSVYTEPEAVTKACEWILGQQK